MVYELCTVPKSDCVEAGFPALIRCMWETYENPVQDLYYVFCPLNACGAENKEQAIEESTARFWEWYKSDPTAVWLKVIDKENGRIAGASLWNVHETNPYAKEQDHGEAYWHPEGGQREYANKALQKHEEVRARCARRPHLYLAIIYAHPDYQRRGIGSLLMDWGVAKAAELGVEMWLNSWPFGRALYERYGFTLVEHYNIKPETDNPMPDEAWKRCQREWTDMQEWVMWRPKDGPFIEGKSVRPWETENNTESR